MTTGDSKDSVMITVWASAETGSRSETQLAAMSRVESRLSVSMMEPRLT